MSAQAFVIGMLIQNLKVFVRERHTPTGINRPFNRFDRRRGFLIYAAMTFCREIGDANLGMLCHDLSLEIVSNPTYIRISQMINSLIRRVVQAVNIA